MRPAAGQNHLAVPPYCLWFVQRLEKAWPARYLKYGGEYNSPQRGEFTGNAMNKADSNRQNVVQVFNRRSFRLQEYDYTQNGAYFVTICADKRRMIFEDISIKKIVEEEWVRTANIRPYIILDEFVVMPEHVHGIIIINKTTPRWGAACGCPLGNRDIARRGKAFNTQTNPRRGAACCAPTRDRPHVTPGSLGAIIRSFKSAVTKAVHEELDFPDLIIWQRNYYEHIIRNDADLSEKRQYIIDNPAKWDDDEYYLNDPATGGFPK
jgi:putative transposase